MSIKHSSEEPFIADKLRAKLREDPFYLAKITLNEEEIQRIHRAIEEYMQVAAPVFEDLSQAGYKLNRLSDLSRKKTYCNRSTYTVVVPILLNWLSQIDDLRVRWDIVSALSVKWAKPIAAPALISEFLRAPDYEVSSYKWAVGNALSVVADDSVFEDIVRLVTDRRHGKAREMLAVALGNMKDPRAVDVLIELLEDDEVAGHALIALRKLKAEKARPHIERFLNHPKTWVRNEAKKALEKLNRNHS